MSAGYGYTPKRCQGQAMTEFVVMTSGVLLILFLVVPALGKLLDMSFQTQVLARYVAWERTVWFDAGNRPGETSEPGTDIALRSDNDVAGTAQKRLLSFTKTPELLSGNDISGPGDNAQHAQHAQHALWRWSNGQQMLSSGGLDSGSLAARGTPSVAYDVLGVYNDGMDLLMTPLTMLKIQKDEDFLQVAHPVKNYYTPSVALQVNLAGSGAEGGAQRGFLPTSLTLRANSAVLADGWNAQGDHHFQERVDDFAIGTMMDNAVINAVIDVIGLFEPTFGDVDFAAVDITPIPQAPVKCDYGFCYFNE